MKEGRNKLENLYKIPYEVKPIKQDTSSFHIGLDKSFNFNSTFNTPDSFGQKDTYANFVENFVKQKGHYYTNYSHYPIDEPELNIFWNEVQKIFHSLDLPIDLISHPIIENLSYKLLRCFNARNAELEKKSLPKKSLLEMVNGIIRTQDNGFSIYISLYQFVNYKLVLFKESNSKLTQKQLVVTTVNPKGNSYISKKLYYNMNGNLINVELGKDVNIDEEELGDSL